MIAFKKEFNKLKKLNRNRERIFIKTFIDKLVEGLNENQLKMYNKIFKLIGYKEHLISILYNSIKDPLLLKALETIALKEAKNKTL